MSSDRASSLRQIGVMRGGALGDFVLTLPVVQALRAFRPGAVLTLLCHPRWGRLAAADQMLDLEDPILAPLFAAGGQAAPVLRRRLAGLDLLVAYTTDPAGPLVAHLSELVGGRVLAADPRPHTQEECHITDHLLTPLQRVGIPAEDRVPRIRVDPQVLAASRSLHGHRRRPLVMIHPGSGARTKCWPRDRFAAVAQQLCNDGCGVLILSGPVEQEHMDNLPGPLCLPADTTQLAAVLAQADLFIGNDSGPGHVAAAVGTPTLSLFGPTDPATWRPRAPWAHYLRADSGDLSQLAVGSVLRAAAAILQESTSNGRYRP